MLGIRLHSFYATRSTLGKSHNCLLLLHPYPVTFFQTHLVMSRLLLSPVRNRLACLRLQCFNLPLQSVDAYHMRLSGIEQGLDLSLHSGDGLHFCYRLLVILIQCIAGDDGDKLGRIALEVIKPGVIIFRRGKLPLHVQGPLIRKRLTFEFSICRAICCALQCV
ncbi:hypothetical protein D3C75_530450 [compost metagenome]